MNEAAVSNADYLAQPFTASLGNALLAEFASGEWTTFRAGVAFTRQSGVRHLACALHDFARVSGNEVRIASGMDRKGTSLEGVQDLWRLLHPHGNVFIVNVGKSPGAARAFHPKVFLFENDAEASAYVGSGNLTAGGLYDNYEATVHLRLLLAEPTDSDIHGKISSELTSWHTPGPACQKVDPALLVALYARGDLPSEASLRIMRRSEQALPPPEGAGEIGPPLFSPDRDAERAPAPDPLPAGLAPPPVTPEPPDPLPATPPLPSSTTAFTPRSSDAPDARHMTEVRARPNGEIHLSIKAIRDQKPGFYGWPFTGWTTPKRAGNPPYPMVEPDPIVDILVFDASGTRIDAQSQHPLNLVHYEERGEIRLTIPARMSGVIPDMSVLIITKDPSAMLDYRLEFHPPDSPTAISAIPLLTERMPGGGLTPRHFGWG